MECPSCHAKLNDEATWCIACGAVISKHAADDAALQAESQLLEAARLREAGLHADAIPLYTRLIETTVEPEKSAPLYDMLGDCYRDTGNIASAANAYRQAVFLAPSDALREKYDLMLDRLRGMSAAPQATTPKHSVTTSVSNTVAKTRRFLAADAQGDADVEEENSHDEHQAINLEQLRVQLTPRVARFIIGAAVVMMLCSLLIIYRPWVQPPSVPKHAVSVQNTSSPTAAATSSPATPSTTAPASASTSTAAPTTTSAPTTTTSAPVASTALPANSESGTNLGKNSHYVKPKDSTSSVGTTNGGGTGNR